MSPIQRIINLVKKTGEKAVILDEKGENGLVVMSLADYEKLVYGKNSEKGLTDDGFLDTINRDIDDWKDYCLDDAFSDNEVKEHSLFGPKYFDEDDLENDDIEPKDIPIDSDDDRYYFEPVE